MNAIDAGAVWHGWKTVRMIGRGNFGAVYEIEREVFGHVEKAAMKVVSIPQSEIDIEELRNDGYDEDSITSHFEECLQDIVREYSTMADMKGCANIVYSDDVKYVQHDNGIGWDVFIKMELLTPLPKALKDTIPEWQVIKVALDICNALAFCEKKNLLHRDIKPQNIYVAADGTCKLGDFGIAKTSERTASGTKTGTYKYMSPEVYNNQPYGVKADIYSLGLVLYWMLNERRTPFLPLPPKTPTASEEEIARARRFAGEPIPNPLHGSDELKRIVRKACEYDQENRYNNASEMLKDLQAISNADYSYAGVFVPQQKYEGMDREETVGFVDQVNKIESYKKKTEAEKYDQEETVGFFRANKETPLNSQPVKKVRENAPTEDKVIDNKNVEVEAAKRKTKKTILIAVASIVAISLLVVAVVLGSKHNGSNTTNSHVQTQTTQDNNNDQETAAKYYIVVWVPEALTELTEQQILDFNKTNEKGICIQATIEPVPKNITANSMILDAENSADIFLFSQDHLNRLVRAGILAKLDPQATELVSSTNCSSAVDAVTINGMLYAYPVSIDNGYCMYYDNSVIPERDLDSLEKLIADTEAKGKYLACEAETSGRFIPSWFMATGCIFEWNTNEKGKYTSIDDTFNSPEGLIAVKGIKKLVNSPMHCSSSDIREFAKEAVVVVSTYSENENAKSMLGNNFGIADLPAFTVDGTEYHLWSLMEYSLLGVKDQNDEQKNTALHLLAQFLTCEKAQTERWESLLSVPTNLAVQTSESVQASAAASALIQQSVYAKAQSEIEDAWWDILIGIGKDIKSASNENELQAALDNYNIRIDDFFTKANKPNDGKPYITKQPVSAMTEAGVVQFSIIAEDAEEYQWYWRSNEYDEWKECSVSTATSPTLVYRYLDAKYDGHQYICKVTNENGFVYSDVVTLTAK